MPIFLSENKLIQHFLVKVRSKESNGWEFGNNLKRITLALAVEAHKEFELKDLVVHTPLGECPVKELSKPVTVIPILRSGLIMSDALQSFFEDCAVVHLGIYRDKNLRANKYYEKFPDDLKSSKIILCDPLIATGVTILTALDILSKYECKNITVLGIVISTRAIEAINEKYPEINIHVAAIDSKLNDEGYIIPGVGDAGNRLYRTK